MSMSKMLHFYASPAKPVVHYEETDRSPVVGENVWISGIWGHPRLGNVPNDGYQGAYTSEILRVGNDGEFETLNTIYRRAVKVAEENLPIPANMALTHD